MKQIYISPYIGMGAILLVGIFATFLILHTVNTIEATSPAALATQAN